MAGALAPGEVGALRWAGKLVGGVLGFATGLGPVGALVGFFIGHAYDESMAREGDDDVAPADAANVRDVNMSPMFATCWSAWSCESET